MPDYVLALDQGTTSSRCMLFDRTGHVRAFARRAMPLQYPQPGWVEQEPEDIWRSQYDALREVLATSGVTAREIAAIGITNQRETTLVWDRRTGEPVCPAIVWQCRRTAPLCERLRADSTLCETIAARTGLRPDAYFSATKLRWILDHVPDAQKRAERGELLFGTVDTFLIWKLTEGRAHITDRTNASRTMLYDIVNLRWDAELCRALSIPMEMLPRVVPSGGVCAAAMLDGVEIPIAGVAGDQQAALYGHGCRAAGEGKNTYGTGCFLLINTGETFCRSTHGLITTLAAQPDGAPVQYALEGSVFSGGAVIQWLRDALGLISDAAEAARLAGSVPDNGGVYLVPAFTGLGAPYWDMYARGAITGLTRGTTHAHIVRAAEESIAYQCRDLVEAMAQDTGLPLKTLYADGGASGDDFLMQFQADVLDMPVCRPVMAETTALGVAALAGHAAGVWDSRETLAACRAAYQRFSPGMARTTRDALLLGWAQAVRRVL